MKKVPIRSASADGRVGTDLQAGSKELLILDQSDPSERALLDKRRADLLMKVFEPGAYNPFDTEAPDVPEGMSARPF